MIIFADLEYYVAFNPDKDPDTTLSILLSYVHIVCEELIEQHQSYTIDIETAHDLSTKISFHLKIPRIIVRDMSAQLSFFVLVISEIHTS